MQLHAQLEAFSASAHEELASMAASSTAALAELGDEMRTGQQEQQDTVHKTQLQVCNLRISNY